MEDDSLAAALLLWEHPFGLRQDEIERMQRHCLVGEKGHERGFDVFYAGGDRREAYYNSSPGMHAWNAYRSRSRRRSLCRHRGAMIMWRGCLGGCDRSVHGKPISSRYRFQLPIILTQDKY